VRIFWAQQFIKIVCDNFLKEFSLKFYAFVKMKGFLRLGSAKGEGFGVVFFILINFVKVLLGKSEVKHEKFLF
jgi:hypothetical protein